jgi:amino acid transporter
MKIFGFYLSFNDFLMYVGLGCLWLIIVLCAMSVCEKE